MIRDQESSDGHNHDGDRQPVLCDIRYGYFGEILSYWHLCGNLSRFGLVKSLMFVTLSSMMKAPSSKVFKGNECM